MQPGGDAAAPGARGLGSDPSYAVTWGAKCLASLCLSLLAVKGASVSVWGRSSRQAEAPSPCPGLHVGAGCLSPRRPPQGQLLRGSSLTPPGTGVTSLLQSVPRRGPAWPCSGEPQGLGVEHSQLQGTVPGAAAPAAARGALVVPGSQPWALLPFPLLGTVFRP